MDGLGVAMTLYNGALSNTSAAIQSSPPLGVIVSVLVS